jgi:hypothetical protein
MPKHSSPAIVDRRERLDLLSTFHLAVQLALFPELSPALHLLSIAQLETELAARTMKLRAERELIEQQIASQRARLHNDILPFLTK